jgi:hypothetical protein
MKGHEEILNMRRSGKRPNIVFLNDHPCMRGELDWARYGENAVVEVHGDQPEWLDLRYLVGLTVSITAANEKRGRRLMQACIKAGAAVVGAGVADIVNGRHESVWFEIWRKEA